MTNLRGTIALVLLVAPVGCDFYFGGGDDDDDCAYAQGGQADPSSPGSGGLRNPETGQCEWTDAPVACDAADDTAAGAGLRAPVADWTSCYDACLGLDVATCRAADGCRAIYVNPCVNLTCTIAEPGEYAGCWGTAPSGPVRGGGCVGLDAFTCSLHDDCSASHAPYGVCGSYEECAGQQPGQFLSCISELIPQPPPVVCETVAGERECIEASHCEPLYEGSDCSCDPMGCGCNVWTYLSCRDL